MEMKSHLNDNEFSELVAGNASQTVLAHLQACAECSVEARDLRVAIGSFRELLGTAAAQPASVAGERAQSRWSPLHVWGLRTAGALALFLMVVGGALMDHNSHRQPVVHNDITVQPQISDTELLAQVQAELSTDAPDALAPADYLAQERQDILNSKSESQRRQ